MCAGCGREDVKVWGDGYCSFCGITRQKGLNVVGLDYATRGRMDRVNSQKDTLRAIDMMAQHPGARPMTSAEAKRWTDTARQMDDRSYKCDPDSAGQPVPRAVSPIAQKSERDATGHMRQFWNECKHDYRSQKGKPKTDTQKQNFDMVKRSGEA